MSTAVHGAQVVGGMQKNHTTRTRVKRPLGLWSRPQRGQGQGGGKGAEEQNFPGLTGLSGGQTPFTCLIARAQVQVWC
jgi:hypothetical protein